MANLASGNYRTGEFSIGTPEGLDALLKTLKALGPAIEKTILNGAMRKGAAVIQKEAIARAPVLQIPSKYRIKGALKSRIVVRKRKRKPNDVATAYAVGLLGGASATYGDTKANRRKGIAGTKYQLQDNAFYWRFIEFGTKNMSARPFLRPAFDTKGQEAIAAIAAGLVAGMARAVTKAKQG